MTDGSLILRKDPDIECIGIDDGTVLKIQDKIHVLNRTAHQIFELVDGCRSVGEIVREMESRYPGEDIEAAVWSFITQMSDSGLVRSEGRG